MEKVVLSQLKGLKQIIVKFRAEQILCTFLIHQSSFLGMHKMLCTKKTTTTTTKERIESVCFLKGK